MNTTILAVRAITWVIIRPFVKTVTGVGLIIALLLIGAELWLMQQSEWWGLMWIFLLPILTIATMVIMSMWFFLSRLTPRKLTRDERVDIKSVANKTSSIIETARTPYPFLLFQVAFDLMRGKDDTVIHRTLSNTQELRDDFIRIRNYFQT